MEAARFPATSLVWLLVKARFLSALPLAAGLTALLVIGGLPDPVLANNGRAVGNPNNGNRGKGPNPSRGNAGRNSGVTNPNSSSLAPRVRFAPGLLQAPGQQNR